MSDSLTQVGFYRFINNPRVSAKDLMEKFEVDTFSKAKKDAVVLAIHDTTQVRINRKLGLLSEFKSKKGRPRSGFFAHVSLLASAETERSEIIGPYAASI